MWGHRRVLTPTARCYTERKIGPVAVVDEADWRLMEAAETSRMNGIIELPEAIPNPPKAGGS